jgi:outer membrane receptor for ferrienterochelin and colicins
MTFRLLVLFFICYNVTLSQNGSVSGYLKENGKALQFAIISIKNSNLAINTDEKGYYKISNIPIGTYELVATLIGYENQKKIFSITELNSNLVVNFNLKDVDNQLEEIVISGTLKEGSKLESPVPIEVYSENFFKANPVCSVFEGLQNINGVRPQLNCNICSTGDIHINGLEGPYTMILVDGMPIVSGLSTVYGLSGIPQSLIDRVEVVKGPASTLYGSEAVGGLINIITKKPSIAHLFSADVFANTWGEVNTDLTGKFKIGKKANSFVGINYFNYSNPIDNNNDGFTDVTLQNRISVFNKWSIERKDNRLFNIAARYVYEDRWGGDIRWNKSFRGGDSIYGENIYTNRWETFGTYQLPLKEKILFQFSVNAHNQNSVYGKTTYLAKQNIGFGQFTWNKELGTKNDLLIGTAVRYTYYDDNTPATASFDTINIPTNKPSITYLPGVFVQDEITLNECNKFLIGIRYDYNSIHGHIFTPRLNYKLSSKNKKHVLRVSAGNGYRVANVFTEDHAALTGSRNVVFLAELKPETSYNGNINFVKKVFTKNNTVLGFGATAFYTYFSNKIFADYTTDPNKIIYDNLKGYAVSQGVSLNLDIAFNNGLKILVGATLMDVSQTNNGINTRQLLTERYTAVWNIGYTIKKIDVSIDYTGNLYGPMKLPLLGSLDPRPEYSPAWSLQNIQITKKIKRILEIYGGVKNFLNWTPNKKNRFIIARSQDPFDKQVTFDTNGQAIATPDNPYALTFDPSYVYGPNQGIRIFFGIRLMIN